AAIYYYINFLSAKGTGLSFNETFTEETLLQGLTSLAKISKRLQNAIITQEDIFIFLKKILRQKGSLEKVIIYLDPPYMGTEDYYKAFNSKDEKFHEKLKELIIKLKKRGAKIILSYRATVTSSNSYTTSEKVQKKLDKLYMNRGFFIQSQKVTNNQIEILLTSEQVEGSIPYDCKIATLI
ncbi:MAG: DNA adenine methylase, partial [Lachnospiraceae bacterium]|nr:DNA adenine methylase [Lachnospiraceae bacterium]